MLVCAVEPACGGRLLLCSGEPTVEGRFLVHEKLSSGGGIRTPECQDQNLVPYHLATPEQNFSLISGGFIFDDFRYFFNCFFKFTMFVFHYIITFAGSGEFPMHAF